MNKCSRCKISEPPSGFHKGQRWCKQCTADVNKAYYAKNRERALRWRRDTNLKRKYGISIADYEEMMSVQGGVCSICMQPEIGRNQYGLKNLAVDHCHTTGRVRGLLCENCNRGLGSMKDNIEILERAILYLKR